MGGLARERLLAEFGETVGGGQRVFEAEGGFYEFLVQEGRSSGFVETLAGGDGLIVTGLLLFEVFAGEGFAVDLDNAAVGEVGDEGLLVEGGPVEEELAVLVAILGVFEVEAGETLEGGLCLLFGGQGLLDEVVWSCLGAEERCEGQIE